MNKLTIQQEKFAKELASTRDEVVALKNAFPTKGFTQKQLASKAKYLANMPKIKERVEEIRKAPGSDLEFSGADIINIWVRIATADASEVVKIVREPCGLCGGATGVREDCEGCLGKGIVKSEIRPSSEWGDTARYLYKGVRQTKFGMEVILRDQDKALENLAKYFGLFETKLRIETGEKQLPSFSDFVGSDEQAAQIYQEMMK
jgi:hypothetical protein